MFFSGQKSQSKRLLRITAVVLMFVMLMQIPAVSAAELSANLSRQRITDNRSATQIPVLSTLPVNEATYDEKDSKGNSQSKGETISQEIATITPKDSDETADGIIVKFKDRPSGEPTMRIMNVGVLSTADFIEKDNDMALVKVEEEDDLSKLLEEIRKDPDVDYAEPNYRLYALEAPNDPKYSEQWALAEGRVLYAPNAWEQAIDIVYGIQNASPVTIAVIDTGVDFNHEDLSGKIIQNGYNAITDETGLNKIMDDSYSSHGTLVSGIAAAATDNGIGIAGAAGRFPVSILPVKVLDSSGTGTIFNTSRGIKWAADNGVKVINLSMGARLPDYPITLADAVRYAQDKGVLVVAAGGNDGVSHEGFYPACLPGVISTGASDINNTKAAFSNDYCSVYAPGVSILSTQKGNKYGLMSGTSAAAPFVSATAALLWSVFPDRNPTQISYAIKTGYNQYGSYTNRVLSMKKSLSNASNPVNVYNSINILSPTYEQRIAGSVEVKASISFPETVKSVSFAYSTEEYDNSKYVEITSIQNNGGSGSGLFSIQWDTSKLPNGKYYIKVSCFNDNGNEATRNTIPVIISNDLKSGLTMKVLKPDGTKAVGAQVSIWHVIRKDGNISYEKIGYDNFRTDAQGMLIMPGSIITDGNDYLITARGSEPNYLYYRSVRAPADVIIDGSDACRFTIRAKDKNDKPLSKAVILSDWLEEGIQDIPRYMYGDSDEFHQVPVAQLNGSGEGEVYLTLGDYNLRLLDPENGYYLVKTNVSATESSISLDYAHEINAAATLQLAPDVSDNVEKCGILLQDEYGYSLLGFELLSPLGKVMVTPGKYTAKCYGMYPDPQDSKKYLKWEHELPEFRVQQGEIRQIKFGGTFPDTNKRIALSIAPNSFMNSQHGFILGWDAWFSAYLTDKYGNHTSGIYQVAGPLDNPVSGNSIIKRLPVQEDGEKTQYNLQSNDDTEFRSYVYNSENLMFQMFAETLISPRLCIEDSAGTQLNSGTIMHYNNYAKCWVTYWRIPDGSEVKQFKAWIKLEAGLLGTYNSDKMEFAARPYSPEPGKPPALTVELYDRMGDPMSYARILLLHREGSRYVPMSSNEYQSGYYEVYPYNNKSQFPYYNIDIIPGDDYAMCVYGKSPVPGLQDEDEEAVFLVKTFKGEEAPMKLEIFANEYSMGKVNIKPRDENGNSFINKKSVGYWMWVHDSEGVPAGMFLQSDYDGNDLEVWLPKMYGQRQANYIIQATVTQIWPFDVPFYLMNKAISMPLEIPGSGINVELGGSSLACISFDINDTLGDADKDYMIGKAALFNPELPYAVVFSPNKNETTVTLPIYVTPGVYDANMVLVRKHHDGSWGYWLKREMNVIPGSSVEWRVSDKFIAELTLDADTYLPGTIVDFANRIYTISGDRLVAVAIGNFIGGGYYSKFIANDKSGGISTQNHDEIAPFISVYDPSGLEVFRYKHAVSQYKEFWNWDNRFNDNISVPSVLYPVITSNTFFEGSYNIPSNASEGNYAAVLELGTGPGGMITSQPSSFTVTNAPGITLNQPVSPTKEMSVSLSGTAIPGIALAAEYKHAILGTVNAGSLMAGNDGSFIFDGIPLPEEGSYEFIIKGYSEGQSIVVSNAVSIIADRTAPTAPANFDARGQSESVILLTWEEAWDNDSIAYYTITRDGTPIATVHKGRLSYTDAGLGVNIEYQYTICAVDRAGNTSMPSQVKGITLIEGDTEKPTVPSGLQVNMEEGGTAIISWNSSTDNVGVKGYRIYRLETGAQPLEIGTVDGLIFIDTGLFADTFYTYAVSAYDAAGNESELCGSVTRKTPSLYISGIMWKLPRKTIDGNAFIGDVLAMTAAAEKNRNVEVCVTYKSWYANDGTLLSEPQTAEALIELEEDALLKGIYRSNFTICYGISEILSIKAVIKDGAGHVAEKQAAKLPIRTSGRIKAVVVAPAGVDLTDNEIKAFINKTKITVMDNHSIGAAIVTLDRGLGTYLMDGLNSSNGYTMRHLLGNTRVLIVKAGIEVKSGLETEVLFESKLPASLSVRIVDAVDGKPLEDVGILCINSTDNNFIASGRSISNGWVMPRGMIGSQYLTEGLISGNEIDLKVQMPEQLGIWYIADDRNHTVELVPGTNVYNMLVQRRDTAVLKGRVTDEAGDPVDSVNITVSQVLPGSLPFSFRAETDQNGNYSIVLPKVKANLSFSHIRTESLPMREVELREDENIIDVQLARRGMIKLKIYARMPGDLEERPIEIDWTVGIHFRVEWRNLNTANMHRGNSTWPYINVAGMPGDTIEVSVSGKEANTTDQTVQVVLDNKRYAEAEIHLVGLGKIKAHVTDEFGNARKKSVRNMYLYKGNDPGTLKYFAGGYLNPGEVMSNGLPEGTYTAIFVWDGWKFNSRISNLTDRIGLKFWDNFIEGEDYIKLTGLEVKNGEICDIGNVYLPMGFGSSGNYFNEREGNGFTSSVTEAITGNIVTFRATYDYNGSPSVSPGVLNLNLDIPENSRLLTGSIVNKVTRGSATPGLKIQSNRIVVELGEGISDPTGVAGVVSYQVKLDSYPDSGRTGARAWMEFEILNEKRLEQIGHVTIDVPYVSINAPSEVRADNTERKIYVHGRASAGSVVTIYDGSCIIGETEASQYGVWNAVVKLADRGKPAEHFLLAQMQINEETVYESRIAKVSYGTNKPVIKNVSMSQIDGRRVNIDPGSGIASFPYVFVPNRPFVFEANFTNNKAVENVKVIFKNDLYIKVLNARYDKDKNCFTASGVAGNSGVDPGNIYIEYTIKPEVYTDPPELIDEEEIRAALPDELKNAEFTFAGGPPGTDLGFNDNGILQLPDINVKFNDGTGLEMNISVMIEAIKDYDPASASNRISLRDGLAVYDTMMDTVGDEFILSYTVPMKALFKQNLSGQQYINAQEVIVNLESTFGRVSIRSGLVSTMGAPITAALKLFSFREKLERLNRLLDKADSCSSNANQYYSQRAADLAQSAFANVMVSYGLQSLGAVCAFTGVGVVGTIGLTAVNGIGGYVANRRWENSFRELQNELDNDDDCKDEDENDNDHSKKDYEDSVKIAEPQYIWDPSGYVYEAVPENRLEGVTATVVYRDTDIGIWKVWDAEWYLQENPLITDNMGVYGWDVPPGQWQVIYEKSGYETTLSDVLTVPPPHTDVNISMISTASPYVTSVVAAGGGRYIDIDFSKFMKAAAFTKDSIVVKPAGFDGEPIEGGIEVINSVTDEKGNVLAKSVRFIPEMPLDVGSSYTIYVNKLVRCYADFFMDTDFVKEVMIVENTPAQVINLNRDTLVMEIAETYTLTAVITPENVTDKRVVWSSSDTSVASVDNTGKVTAKAPGNAVITVITAEAVKRAECAVTVLEEGIPVKGVKLDRKTLKLNIGEAFTLTEIITPLGAKNRNVTYSSDNTEAVSVDNTGKVTARAAGIAEITVTTDDGSKRDTCLVVVEDRVAVIGVELNHKNLSLGVGDTFSLLAAVTPANASDKRVTWTSSNNQAASVDSTGKITAIAAGTAIITVTTVDGGKSDMCTVNVTGPFIPPVGGGTNPQVPVPVVVKVTGVRLDRTSLVLFENGEPILLTATVEPNEAADKSVTWTSSDETVVTVSNGLATPIKPGRATITVKTKDGDKTAVCTVLVKTVNELRTTVGPKPQRVIGFEDEVALDIGEAAFEIETELVIKRSNIQETSDGNKMNAFSRVYELSAGKVKLKKPVLLTIRFDRGMLGDIDYRKLGVYYRGEDTKARWTYVGGALDMEAGTVEVWVEDLGSFAVMVYEKTFDDIAAHWSRNDVEVLASRHIINGVTQSMFQPERLITRAEMSKLIVSMLQRDPEFKIDLKTPATQTFTDVGREKWYYSFIETAAHYGIVKGNNGKFRPDDYITREEMAIMIARVLNTQDELLASEAFLPHYTDEHQISKWAMGAVALMQQKGIMNGYKDGKFMPKACTKRSEAAVVILRVMELKGLIFASKTIKGKVEVSDIEGMHYELKTCPLCDLPPIYVLIPIDEIISAKLKDAVGKKVTIKAIPIYGADIYMRGPLLKVISVSVKA